MTVVATAVAPTVPSRRAPRALDARCVALVVFGCVALWMRPWLVQIGPPAAVLAVVFAALLGVGLAVPVEPPLRSSRGVAITATLLGCGAVLAAHALVVGRAPVPLAPRFVLLDIVAAIAEEAFFRRFLYGIVRPHGVVPAVAVTTVLFAVVHISTYGAWVLPLDLAVGLLFAWQREVSGRWTAPLVTHVLANLLVVL
jgi:membrane protease YdiL (CAAX protease family)